MGDTPRMEVRVVVKSSSSENGSARFEIALVPPFSWLESWRKSGVKQREFLCLDEGEERAKSKWKERTVNHRPCRHLMGRVFYRLKVKPRKTGSRAMSLGEADEHKF